MATSRANEASLSAANAATSEANALTYKNAAQTSATHAANSATTANTKAGEATTSATNAANSAGTATTQAGIATTQAGIATTKAAEASDSAAAAAASYDAFDDRFLGAKAVEPTIDNDGNALQTGALYFNTTLNVMRVFNGTDWQSGYAPGGTMPLIFPVSAVQADATIYTRNLALTPGTLTIPSGVTISVEPEAQWLIMGDGASALQYRAEFDAWETVKGVAKENVGTTDTQTLTNKTLTAPAINDPIIVGGSISGASFLIQAAVSHTHTIDDECDIPAGCNALSIAPINLLPGGIVNVGVGSVWSFLWT